MLCFGRKCCVCNSRIEKYTPIDELYNLQAKKNGYPIEKVCPETLNREEYECPVCYALDRDRLFVLFLKRIFMEYIVDGKAANKFKILDIAPSPSISRWIRENLGMSEYVTVDLYMEHVDYNADIQNLDMFSKESFDFVICSHVFEHVSDDSLAMREVHRVLKKDGLAILMVPLDLNVERTDECSGEISEEEKWKRFGQGDHLRKYKKEDYVNRLIRAGFFVHQFGKDYFGTNSFRENAITDTSILYVGGKKDIKDKKLKSVFFKDHKILRFESFDSLQRTFRLVRHPMEFYIDTIEKRKNQVYIWGWAFLKGLDSRKSKLKLLLYGQDKFKVIEFVWRERSDIEEIFNKCKDGQLIYSGIDIETHLRNIEILQIGLLILNEERYGIIWLDNEYKEGM